MSQFLLRVHPRSLLYKDGTLREFPVTDGVYCFIRIRLSLGGTNGTEAEGGQ